jgi:hypothetical protein
MGVSKDIEEGTGEEKLVHGTILDVAEWIEGNKCGQVCT